MESLGSGGDKGQTQPRAKVSPGQFTELLSSVRHPLSKRMSLRCRAKPEGPRGKLLTNTGLPVSRAAPFYN